MNPSEILNRVYLGDRAIKKIIIDGWARSVSIQIDCISVMNNREEFNILNNLDIDDGYLVFQEVSCLTFKPEGYLPNDYVEVVAVEQISKPGIIPQYLFTLSTGFVDEYAISHEVLIKITAEKVSVKDHMMNEMQWGQDLIP